jgi:hypothetical protein
VHYPNNSIQHLAVCCDCTAGGDGYGQNGAAGIDRAMGSSAARGWTVWLYTGGGDKIQTVGGLLRSFSEVATDCIYCTGDNYRRVQTGCGSYQWCGVLFCVGKRYSSQLWLDRRNIYSKGQNSNSESPSIPPQTHKTVRTQNVTAGHTFNAPTNLTVP